MKFLTYVLTAGVGFWIGVAHTMASRPDQLPPRIVVEPANHVIQETASCTELARACYAKRRSARIQGRM